MQASSLPGAQPTSPEPPIWLGSEMGLEYSSDELADTASSPDALLGNL
jgi:hypothetical protein